MMIQKILSKISFVLAVLIVLVSIGCTGVGIFAVVAVSEKIDEGLLPEGISGRPVVHIAPVPADGTEDYYFFASGPGIWAKNHVTNSLWRPISLVSGGIEWDGVQSMAVAGDRIFLALYDVNGDNYKVAIHTLDAFNGTPTYTEIANAQWANNPGTGGYTTLRLFAPDPTGPVYVNVMNHSGTYGSLDEDNQGFIGSTLHTLPIIPTNLDWAIDKTDLNSNYLDGTNGTRYVTGVADKVAGPGVDNDIRITATKHMFYSSGGILLDGGGNPVGGDGSVDGTFVPTRGITWLKRTGVGDG